MNLQNLIASNRYSSQQLSRELEAFGRLFWSISLDFTMQAQTQSQWCWAATATSVSHYYLPWSGWTQCRVANAELGFNNCCNSPVPGPCNVPWYLDRALTRTDNFVSITAPASFEQIRSEIRSGRVVGARIGWSGGGGHFMVIYGCATIAGVEYFDIDDPIYGKSQLTVDTFTNSYQGNGSWTHTYFTKRARIMKIKLPLLTEIIIRLIEETRPLLSLKYKELEGLFSQDLTVALPHYLYTMGLDDIAEARQLPVSPSALRVLEMHEDKGLAFFDLTPDPEAPTVRQLSGNHSFLDLLNRGIAKAVELSERHEAEAELRLLQVPALYVDALWLHYDEASQDILIPLRAPGLLNPFETYSVEEFFGRLSEPARERMAMDDLMGS
ncbi:MAG TPA: papain-like cysteine protease family protein [Allocoleopsis sp.]